MRYVELPGTDLRVSVLGFGCAAVMGRVDRRTALDALEKAYACGINYFDVARSYGYGEAESVLGEFIQGRREDVIVATKVGLKPPPPLKRGFLRTALPMARKVMSLLPRQARNVLKRSAGQSGMTKAPGGHFEVEQVRRSLETSLESLSTDYVDILLLHSCEYEDIDESLLSFLRSCVSNGTIKNYGVATDTTSCRDIISEYPQFGVAQVTNNVYNNGISKIPEKRNVGIITHSSFGQNIDLIQKVTKHVKGNKSVKKRCNDCLSLDVRDPENVAKVLLSYAIHKNTGGVVLCGMFDKDHIHQNIRTAIDPIPERKIKKVLPIIENLIKKAGNTNSNSS